MGSSTPVTSQKCDSRNSGSAAHCSAHAVRHSSISIGFQPVLRLSRGSVRRLAGWMMRRRFWIVPSSSVCEGAPVQRATLPDLRVPQQDRARVPGEAFSAA